MSNILDRIYRGIKKFRPDLNDQDAMRYAYTIVDASAESNVDPVSITAQIAQESSFNPQAVSRTGPKGLAQLSSRMAKHYGVSDPFDPVQSIYAMAEAMQDNLKKNKRDNIGDSWALAQMRYAEGGPRMKNMLKSGDLTQQAKTYSSQIEKRKSQMFEDTTPYEFTYSGGDLPEITVKPDMMKKGGKIKKYQDGGNLDPTDPKPKAKKTQIPYSWGTQPTEQQHYFPASYSDTRKAELSESPEQARVRKMEYFAATGLLPELKNQNLLTRSVRKPITKNLIPYGYPGNAGEFLSAAGNVLTGKRTLPSGHTKEEAEKRYRGVDYMFGPEGVSAARQDIFNMSLGLPQQHGSYEISPFLPTDSKNPSQVYLRPKNISKGGAFELQTKQELVDAALHNLDKEFTDKESKRKAKTAVAGDFWTRTKADRNNLWELTETTGANFTSDLGSDEHGNYVSYWDVWDYDKTTKVGKPIEIYDRIYYDKETKKVLEKQPTKNQNNEDMKTTKGARRYAVGGVIDPLVQSNPYMAAAGIGIDLIRTAVENSRRPADTRNLNENVNPYGFMAKGGRINIEGGETITDATSGSNIFIAKGPRHEQGGIDMKASGGVVKSDRIGYDKQGYITTNPKAVKKTFADVDKRISDQLKDRFDPISKKTKELVIQKTERDNVAVTEAENQFKYGGKMKYALGGGLPGFMGIPGLENYIQGDQMFNPDFDSTKTMDFTRGKTAQDSSTPISFADSQLWGDSAPAAHSINMAKTPRPRTPLSPMDGEQMSKFGALAGGTYSMIDGLINRPEKERPRTLSTQFRGNYYNPTTERQANQTALTTALRGQNYMGSGVDNVNRIAALSGYQQNEGNIARSKFNYDSQVDQRRSMFNLQRDQFNTQSLAATDVMNAQNRAQGRNLRRQGIGNQLQSIANVGDYSNRQTEQQLKIGLLKDLFANYGIEANTIQELTKMIASGDYYKNPNKNGG